MPRTDLSPSLQDVDNETDDATFWFIGKKQLIPAGVIFDESKIRSHTRHR
jgi:hypothetical protein